MSYIYEALKRAEDENARGVVAPGSARRPAFFATRPHWWLWALMGILAANAAVLVTLVLTPGSRAPDVTMTSSTEPVAGPAVSPTRDADAAAVTPSAPPARTVAPTPPVARAVPPASSSVGPAERPARPSAARATPPVPESRASTPSTVARDPGNARPASSETARPATPVAPSSPVVARPAPAPAPENVAPPVETPKLQVQVVVYSDVPAERMVIIDGRRYAEGQQVDAETVVERITPDGAIVSRGGQRFSLTSGRP